MNDDFMDALWIYPATNRGAYVYRGLSVSSHLLPTFVERHVLRHINASTILASFDKVYIMALKIPGVGAPPDWLLRELSGGTLTNEDVQAVRLSADTLLLAWCTVDTLIDARFAGVEVMEVPAPLRGMGLGRLMLRQLQRLLSKPILPVQPLAKALGFWCKAAEFMHLMSSWANMGVRTSARCARRTCAGRWGFCRCWAMRMRMRISLLGQAFVTQRSCHILQVMATCHIQDIHRLEAELIAWNGMRRPSRGQQGEVEQGEQEAHEAWQAQGRQRDR